jgi:dTDP-4-dehydrorhamnose 3,5-epimerase
MKFIETDIEGAYKIQVEKFGDDRGFFGRGYCEKEFLNQGIKMQIVQANIGFSKKKHTIRGLHYQLEPYAEDKLVRCDKGSLLDVAVDIRKDSSTYGKSIQIELNENELSLVFIPAGCAHGYQTLTDDTEIYYMVSAFYSPDHERGIRWNDPAIDVKWRESHDVIISDKDKNWPDFKI